MSAVLYYGTAAPDPVWAAGVTTDVVLQPYHPLIQHGGFAEAFPRARRFVYVNPTSIDPWRLERRRDAPPLLDEPDPWGLPRLDLRAPGGLEIAVEEAVAAASPARDELDGVFVDDLDRVVTDPALVARFVAGVEGALGWQPLIFANRGFALWPNLLRLSAVLLEDFRATAVDRDDADGVRRWIDEVVLPAIEGARARGAVVHRLEYADAEPAAENIERLLAQLDTSPGVSESRRLDAWPSVSAREGTAA